MLRTSEFILNFVLNSCWQIGAIFAVTALASRLIKNGPARYGHALWVFALIACLVVPLLTATRFVPAWLSSFQVQTEPSVVAPGPIKSIGSQEDLSIDRIGARRTTRVSAAPRSILVLGFCYTLFVFGRGLRLARFWQRKERLRRTTIRTGLGSEVESAAQRCRELLGIRDVTVTQSAEARVPYTIGARRPLIVLPDAYCATVDEAKLLSVVGHEMAHVARRDFLTNLICELVALPISFHPLTYLLKREIDRTRELACDELVTRRVLAPKLYARSLLWAADVSRQYSSQAFMLSIFDGKILEERIVRLMRSNRRVGARLARTMMFAAISILCFSALSLSMFAVELQTQVRAAVTQSILTSTTQDDRATSACNAARRGDVEAIPTLIAMLGDDSKTEVIRCWDTSRWSPALQTFKHPSPGEQAALALASFGRPAFAPLSGQLDSGNAVVRRNAAWAIGELTNMVPGERAAAVPQLITLLGDSDEWVRMAAATALGELRDRRAVHELVATLADDDWRVRELVAWALGEIRSAEALPALRQALQDGEAPVRTTAAWAISEIEG